MIALAAGCLLGSLAGCQEKSGAEKRAEELARENEAAAAAASAKAAEPDPREQQYATARKALIERQKAQLAALEKIYRGVSEDERKAFSAYFAPTKEGEKEAEELSKEAAFAGKQGMTLKRYEVTGDQLNPQMTGGTTDVFVEETQRGLERCTTYKVEWKLFGSEWRRVERRDFRIVPCS